MTIDANPRIVSYFGKPESDLGIIGPTEGFSPQIGVLVSILAFTRAQVLNCVRGMSVSDLDFLLDVGSNTIGAMLFHLAATETYYQLNTFDGMRWGEWPASMKRKWDVAMNLGDEARKAIKANSIDYYLALLREAREKTLEQLRNRDDVWLAEREEGWDWNNYAKWLHVAEHESNHNGQFKFLRSRLAKTGAQIKKNDKRSSAL
jgi:Protein of unknown function (DUF664)